MADPIGLHGGINRYGYVGGNPVGFLDPSGLIAVVVTCADPIDNYNGVGCGQLDGGGGVVVEGTYDGGAYDPGAGQEQGGDSYGDGGFESGGNQVDGYKQRELDHDCSPAITPEELKMMKAATLGDFWDSRYELGDPWANVGRGMWSANATPAQVKMGKIVIGRLIAGLAIYTTFDPENGVSGEDYHNAIRRLGVLVANQHLHAIDNSYGNFPLSFKTVAKYHHTVFSQMELPASAYGGTPLGPIGSEIQGSLLNMTMKFRSDC